MQIDMDLKASLFDFASRCSPVVFYVAEPEEGWPLSFVSENCEAVLGHRAVDLAGNPGLLNSRIHPDDRAHARPTLKTLRAAGAFTKEFRLADKSGDYRWYRDEGQLRSVSGREIIIGCLIEITPEKRESFSMDGSQDLVRHVLEACPVPLRMTRLENGEILYESPSSKAAYGSPIDDAPKMVLDHYVNPSDRDAYVNHLVQHGYVDNHVVEFRRADGSKYPGLVSANLINLQGSKVIVSTTIDLTERLEKETEIRRARETLEDAIEALSEGFALYDKDDRLIICNRRYREIHSSFADMLVPGMSWVELMQKEADSGFYVGAIGREQEWVVDRLKARRELQTGLEYEQTDGRWIEGANQYTRQGGVVVTLSDITERKKHEQELRESENLVRRVLEACPVPITMNHVESGDILYQSPAALELYTGSRTENKPSVLSRWADISQRQAYLDTILATGAIDGWEIERVKHDGSKFWALESGRLVEYQGQRVIVSSVLDLTERREKDAEIERQREALHQSEKLSALGELLAGVSHELNNPLSVLVGQAQLLKETVADREVMHRAEKINEAADRCARIVKSFLSMARQEPIASQPTDINDVIVSALEVTAYGLRASDINVELELASELPPVMLDSDQFRQVVTNLLVNAQHALEQTQHERTLTITTRENPGEGTVALLVADNGPGISSDLQKRIFEPLFTTKEVGRGTGIGLALCNRIVGTHGGSIRVESGLGEGAAFIVNLPAANRRTEAESNVGVRSADNSGVRVLLIDDEPSVADVIAEILKSDGHNVQIVHSGEEALKALAKADYDVLLCDLRMPNLDGPGLYRRLLAERPELVERMGFLTGDTLGARAREFLRTVDCPFIEKPVTVSDAREIVSDILSVSS